MGNKYSPRNTSPSLLVEQSDSKNLPTAAAALTVTTACGSIDCAARPASRTERMQTLLPHPSSAIPTAGYDMHPLARTPESYIELLGRKCHKYEFIRWDGEYRNQHSKAIMRCPLGHEWSARVDRLFSGTGCRQCAINARAQKSSARRKPETEVINRLNGLPYMSFVCWENEYRNKYSRATMQCSEGHEWHASVASLLNQRSGCPFCHAGGYDKSKPGTLYVLRSDCGSKFKIGISNDYQRRHKSLRAATPFNWRCVKLIHCLSGAFIARLEKQLHAATKPVHFTGSKFDGHTEWREWAAILPSALLKADRRAAMLDRLMKFIG